MAFDGTGWDIANPTNATLANQIDDYNRDLRLGVAIRANKEHVTYAANSVGGEHKEGSAKAYYEASEPTTRPDASTALNSADAGRFWIDSDNGYIYYYNGTAWALLCPTAALSNLASVAINTSLLPGTDDSVDLGSATKQWKSLYLDDGIIIDGTTLSAAVLKYLSGITSSVQTQLNNRFPIASPYSETKTCTYNTDTTFTHGRGHDPIANLIVASPNVAEWTPIIKTKNSTSIVVYNPSTTIDVTVQAW